jgi:exodeoxyribonuclease V alpha subunit
MSVKYSPSLFPNVVDRSYDSLVQQLDGILPIDYYLAKQVVGLFDEQLQTNQQSPILLFMLVMALNKALRDGHTCLPINAIANTHFGQQFDEQGELTKSGFCFESAQYIDDYLNRLPVTPSYQQPIVYEYGALYLRRYYQFEVQVAEQLYQRIHSKKLIELLDCQRVITTLFASKDETDEIDWQQVAVANALNKGFSIIAGGPGTGKTYTVTKLMAALIMQATTQGNVLSMALAAPTGKAAQRLSESISDACESLKQQIPADIMAKIPQQATTIHRLLGVRPNQVKFIHHQQNPLVLDVLVIDEVSMVDLALFHRLLQAIPEHCQLIVLGDADQLPAVATGSVLAELAVRPHLGYSRANHDFLTAVCEQNVPQATTDVQAADHVTFLTKSRRFTSDSEIGQLAKSVIAGDAKSSIAILKQANDTVVWDNSPRWLEPLIEQYYLPIFSCDTVTDALKQFAKFRVLCSVKQGNASVELINQTVSQYLFDKQLIPSPDLNKIYRGKPILIEQNHYPLGLFNGDMGMFWPNNDGLLMAVFEQNQQLVWILPSQLPQHSTVYAMTIHKTQGSEFEHVGLVLPESKQQPLLTRELLYTGITRAKQQLTVHCLESVWFLGVNQQVQRFSHLGKRLNANQ